MALPHVPFDSDEERFPLVRAAQQLRRMNVQPVLVEPDSPAQTLAHPAYYVPPGYFRPGSPAAVVLRENLDDNGGEEALAMLRGAIRHAAVRFGLAPGNRIVALDAAESPCSPRDEALLHREVGIWWSWWAPRNRRRAGKAPEPARAGETAA